jgi:hypothetical protein
VRVITTGCDHRHRGQAAQDGCKVVVAGKTVGFEVNDLRNLKDLRGAEGNRKPLPGVESHG